VRLGASMMFLSMVLCLGAETKAIPSDEEAVRGVMVQEIAAWARYDAKGVASLYTGDAIWQNPFGVRLRGGPELEKFLNRLFQRPGYRAAKETSEPKITDLRIPAPGVAVVWSEESSEGQIDDASGKPMLPRHSYYLEVLVKKEGAWKITDCIIMDEKNP
jgi:uncharacterized protein (TIGR02246 family)